ncbi:uncharacterized protein LOC129912048 isoform X1 [Episyrphus balteatus]|uniref:uncharacterized protein LOC129912048 isoform X1 n=1 Tax=Episyrphus balteatus TaxID=286459 RepID=UPI00248582BD|nr:uncharacterized protein LOC129912048 isoform X1 [Episyrphus balteatus]
MLDTLIYIPTVLAYTFISLLVVILCFIVVYVSHKVYLNIYDILPVTPTNATKSIYKSKSAPALRIYIWIGRSRLAILVLEPVGSAGTLLLKYTDSISTIPWNENNNNSGRNIQNCNKCICRGIDHYGVYVT